MSVSQPINSFMKTEEKYSVTAAWDGESKLSTNKVTGDRENGLFTKKEDSGKMDFLKLLTAQLQYQDPMSPMENTEFVAQLAQFTQLESTSNMEAAIKDMAKIFGDSMDLQTFNAQSTTNAASVSLVGKQVRLRQNTFEYNGGDKTMEFTAHLGEKSKAVVNIVDGDGMIVKSIELTNKDDTNAVKFEWDGKDATGKKVPADTYNLIIEGQETNESLYCFVEDVVTGLRYTSQGAKVRVGGIELNVSDLLEVKNYGSGSGGGSISNSDLTMGQALGMVGYDVKVGIDKLTYTPEPNKSTEFKIDLGGNQSATLVIKDKDGKEVDRITINATDLAQYKADKETEYKAKELDKKNNKEKYDENYAEYTVPYGTFDLPQTSYGNSDKYTIEISNISSAAYFYQEGSITGVVNQGGYPQLKMGTSSINFADIMELKAAA